MAGDLLANAGSSPASGRRSHSKPCSKELHSERRQSELPLRNAAGACRPDPCAGHQCTGGADLPDHLLHLQRCRAWRPPVRAEGIRQYLHAHHESDHRRLRTAHRGTRRRGGGGCHQFRAGGAVPGADDDCPGRRQHRLHQLPLRRHLQPVQGRLCRGWGSTSSLSMATIRRISGSAIDDKTKAIYVETIGNPASISPTSRPWPRWLTMPAFR
jgi:hypothetical protein